MMQRKHYYMIRLTCQIAQTGCCGAASVCNHIKREPFDANSSLVLYKKRNIKEGQVE